MEVAETIEYRDHTIEVFYETYDMDIFNPRDWDNLGTMNCAHRNYNLGDEQDDPETMIVSCPLCGDEGGGTGLGVVPVPTTGELGDPDGPFVSDWEDKGWTTCPRCDGSGEVVDPIRWAVESEGATVVLGLYLYDHSGITMSASTLYRDGERVEGGNPFTCRWDSGMVGILYDTPEGVKRSFGKHERDEESGKYLFTGQYHTEDGNPPSAERIEEILYSEVKVYDDYLTGDIRGYRIEGPVCDDSCGGFFPDHDKPYREEWDHMIAEAKANIDHSIKYEAEQVEKIDRMMAI